MQFEALSLLKLVVVAGLAYLSYRKTCKIKQLQRRVFVSEDECIIKELGRAKEPIISQELKDTSRKNNKTTAYQQFVSAYKDIPFLQEMEEQDSDFDQQSLSLSSIDLQKLQAVSTIAPETRRETSSVHSQFINQCQCQEAFFDQQHPQRLYPNTRQLIRELRRKKIKAMHQRTVKNQKHKILKQFYGKGYAEKRRAGQ